MRCLTPAAPTLPSLCSAQNRPPAGGTGPPSRVRKAPSRRLGRRSVACGDAPAACAEKVPPAGNASRSRSLRRSPHGSGRIAPSRFASLAWLRRLPWRLSPLTARQSAAAPRASRSERPRGRTYQLSSIRCVCPTARSAYIAGRITTGLRRRVRRRGAIACCNTRGGYAGAVLRRVAGAESTCRRLTGHSPSTHSLGVCCGAGADSPCAVRGLVCRAHCKIGRLPRPRFHA
jgi:hypothetical protein